jgi:hypothetical protein
MKLLSCAQKSGRVRFVRCCWSVYCEGAMTDAQGSFNAYDVMSPTPKNAGTLNRLLNTCVTPYIMIAYSTVM